MFHNSNYNRSGKILPNTKVEEKDSHSDASLLYDELWLLLILNALTIDLSSQHLVILSGSSLRPFSTTTKLMKMCIPIDGVFDPF
jgi:hypothetical protein